ncbi:HPP family protein [Chitinolyticbacter meiyuanensis]|uniref:HPP family protein n=1 Tax=Chitinolyticbacter meiyuanensis TaxID=682798 RepID=UPI0011E5D3A9
MLTRRRDRILASVGACIGMLVTAWACQLTTASNTPWFIAPMGASAVLLFAVPASPLAQPWSLIGGNLLSALIGVTCAQWITSPILASGCAVAFSIAAMHQFRCIHPPSGAVALTAVLGGEPIHQLGYAFVLHPVLQNSLFLVVVAIFYNNIVRRPYPHKVHPPATHKTTDPPPIERSGITREDLHAALEKQGELYDINEEDLQEILLQAQLQAHRRRFGELTCRDFMAKDVVFVNANDPTQIAYDKLREHKVSALPVLGNEKQLVGIVTLHDLFAAYDRISLTATKVWQIMTGHVVIAKASDPITSLVEPFSNGGLHHMPVLDETGGVVGMVTQSDLVAAMFQEQLELTSNNVGMRSN